MKLVYVIVLMLFQYLVYGQGTVLEYGESGSLLRYGISETGNSNERLHSLFYGYSFQRKVDIGMGLGVVDDVNLIGGSISGYLDSRPLQFKTSLLFSKSISTNSDWNKGINLTAFYFKSGPKDGFTPSVGFTFAGTKAYSFNFEFDFLIKVGNAGLVLGIEYIVHPENVNFLSSSVGILF